MHSKLPDNKILLNKAKNIIKKESIIVENQDNLVRRAALKLMNHAKDKPNIKQTSGIKDKKISSKLKDLLKVAEFFSADSLIKALGEELYKIAKPIGYADQKRTTILIRAASSAHMQEIHYRKKEIIAILKQNACFKNIERIKIVI